MVGGDARAGARRPSRGVVAHLCHHDDRRGAEVFAYELSRRLATVGFESTVHALRSSGVADPLPVPTLGGPHRTPRHLFRARRLAAGSDVMVGYGAGTLLFGAAATAGSPTRFVYRVIGDPAFWGQVRLADLRIGLPLRQAERIVVLWPDAATTLQERYGIDPTRIEVIPNGRDHRRFRPPTPEERTAARAAFGIRDERPVVGYLGALSWEKDPLVALRSVLAVPDATLLVAGTGPMHDDLAREAAAAGGRVHLLGGVSDPLRVYHALDALILTSRTEGMPGVVIEASLCGVPSVAPDVGGTGTLVDESTGLLVPAASDPATFADALQEVLVDAAARGAAARARAASDFSIDAVADRWGVLLDGVIASGPLPGMGARLLRRIPHATRSAPSPTNAPLRSLHLIATDSRRGAEVFGSQLVDELGRRGTAHLRALTTTSSPTRLGVQGYRRRSDPRALLQLRKESRDYDVVVGHGAGTLLSAAAALLGTSTPYVYRSIGDPGYWRSQRRATGLRVGLPLHRAQRVVALWPGAAKDFHDAYGVPWDRLEVIPNAVQAERFTPPSDDERADARAELGLGDGPVVVYLGALTPEKRPELAISVAARWPQATLLMAGAGADLDPLTRQAAAEAPRTRLLGAVADPRMLLAAADALLLTSATEGMPGVAIEAGLTGLPVVATDVGGTGEVVVDGATGRLIEAPDPDALAEALRWAVARSSELGQAARQRCLERFSMEAVSPQWEALLHEITGRPAP